ncbi:hypothetical protein D3C74_304150 [compost metagenome]
MSFPAGDGKQGIRLDERAKADLLIGDVSKQIMHTLNIEIRPFVEGPVRIGEKIMLPQEVDQIQLVLGSGAIPELHERRPIIR